MEESDEYLSAGQMAELNQITKKALRVYEQKKLLVPSYTNPETGYRYYTYDQCSTLDMIVQMQSAGFSLVEMRQVLDGHDLQRMSRILDTKIEDIDRRARELEIDRCSAQLLKQTCELYEELPECEVVQLEWSDRRPILFFPIEPYQFQPRQTAENPRLRRWEKALRSIKRQFVEEGIPIALFHNIGCVVSRDSLLDHTYQTIGGFIYDERGYGSRGECWEAAWHLTVTIDSVFMEDGRHAEYWWMERLLQIAQAKGYTVIGHYYSEMLAETPLFNYEGRDMMMRLHLPVDIGEGEPGDGPFVKRVDFDNDDV